MKGESEMNNSEERIRSSLKEKAARLTNRIPQDADRAVLAFIDERARSIREAPRKTGTVRYVAWAAAAALAAAVGVWTISPARRSSTPPAVAEDIDRSGTVDILDAFLMARRLETAADRPASWDFNRDGRVDGADVDLVAQRAVAVTKEGT
jgi:hypothetical protein